MKRVLNLFMVFAAVVATMFGAKELVMAQDSGFNEVVLDSKKDIESVPGLKCVYLGYYGDDVVEYKGHQFIIKEGTTCRYQTDGQLEFTGNLCGLWDDDAYTVIDGAKYSLDGKTLIAIPYGEKTVTIKEGTTIVNLSAIIKYGNYYYGGIGFKKRGYSENDAGELSMDEYSSVIVAKKIVFPKSLKEINFDMPEYLDWHSGPSTEKLTFKNGKLSVDTISELLEYFDDVKASNLKFPKKYTQYKKGMRIYKKYLVRYTGKAKKLEVPKGVKGIGSYAFATHRMYEDNAGYSGNKTLQTVILPSSVKVIKNHGFYKCKKLKRVKVRYYGVLCNVTARVKRIGEAAFDGTKVK